LFFLAWHRPDPELRIVELLEYFRLYLSTLGWALVMALIFYVPERLAPAEKNQPAAKRIFNLVYTPIVIGTIFLLQPLFGPFYLRALNFIGGGLLPVMVNEQSGLFAQLLFALSFAVVWDTWQYWIHRLQHTNAFLWQTHKFHHSDTALNSTSQARHHALNSLLMLVSYFPVLLLFGSQQPHFIATFVMFRLWGFVNHANVRLNLGPFTPLVAGPQWHRIHHSVRAEHLNRNYATFFPFLDMLFGTYYAPQKEEYPATGLPPGELTSDLREATFSPLISWYRMASEKTFKGRPVKSSEQELT
jgi:sterol desaturase/sphingolipid hydroxylase (fatty acid hydroxylase superfamily)